MDDKDLESQKRSQDSFVRRSMWSYIGALYRPAIMNLLLPEAKLLQALESSHRR
jgi:hypothetical protein